MEKEIAYTYTAPTSAKLNKEGYWYCAARGKEYRPNVAPFSNEKGAVITQEEKCKNLPKSLFSVSTGLGGCSSSTGPPKYLRHIFKQKGFKAFCVVLYRRVKWYCSGKSKLSSWLFSYKR